MAHQFWISYHPPTAKHTSSGDETPPIPEEELEQQKIEHEHQVQKGKERQAREAEEVKKLDIELLHQRAIEAEEEQKREIAEEIEELRGMNTSWSYHRLCDLQRQAARLRQSRPSITDSIKSRSALKKACSAQLTKLESSNSICEHDGIFINLSRRGSANNDIQHFESCTRKEPTTKPVQGVSWHASANELRTQRKSPLVRVPSCPGKQEWQGRGTEMSGGKESSQMSRSESTISRCTPHTPLGPTDSASVDSNPMSSIYRCRAPIASLDCMDDFSANSQQMLDQACGDLAFSRHLSTYLGNHNTMAPIDTPGLRHRNLGKSGLRVPNVGLGLWAVYGATVPEEVSEEMINIALDNGINLFDLSEAHCAKAETELGRILKKRNVKRTSVIVTTKIYWSTKSDERGLSRKHIIESIKTSLSRLQLDYIDVVLLHKLDPVCPMEELVRTMNYVINQGLVMYWGTARWSPSEIMEAYSNCRQFNCIPPVVEQTEYHMFCREKTELYMPELYHKIGVGMIGWSAITTGKGLGREEVTGLFAKSRFNRKYSTFSWCEEDIAATEVKVSSSKEQVSKEDTRTYGDKLRDLSNLANSLNCSLSQLAVAWCLKNETVNCLLLGATSLKQLRENIHALQIVPQLTPILMSEIERLLGNKPQRPPMVSTLAMRNQQNIANNAAENAEPADTTVRIDMTGATTSTAILKPESGDAADIEASGSGKDSGKPFCEIQ